MWIQYRLVLVFLCYWCRMIEGSRLVCIFTPRFRLNHGVSDLNVFMADSSQYVIFYYTACLAAAPNGAMSKIRPLGFSFATVYAFWTLYTCNPLNQN